MGKSTRSTKGTQGPVQQQNRSAEDLLKDIGLDQTAPDPEGDDGTVQANGNPQLQNRSADQLLNDAGIAKKKDDGGSPSSNGSTSTPTDSPDNTPVDPAFQQQINSYAKGGGPMTFAQPAPAAAAAPEAPKAPDLQQKKLDAIDFIKQDYNANRGLLDRALTTDLKNPLGRMVAPQDQSIAQGLTAENAGSDLLQKYRSTRLADVNQQQAEAEKNLDQKYPQHSETTFSGPGMASVNVYRDNEAKYNEELAKTRQFYDDLKAKVTQSVDFLADQKILNEAKQIASPQELASGTYINPKKFGQRKRQIMGDETVDKELRYEAKGIPVADASKYDNDKIGLSVAQNALATQLDNLMKGNPNDVSLAPNAQSLIDQIKQVDGMKQNLLNTHSEYRKQQVVRALSDRLYKDKNWFQTMTGAYTITQDDISRAAGELGLNNKLVGDVTPGDIKTANIFGTFVNELAAKPGSDVGSFLGRPFRKYVLGQDPDVVDEHYDQMKKKFTSFLADQPDAQNLFGADAVVDTDKKNGTFLEDIKNARAHKFNWNPDAIANALSGGFAQLMQFAQGSEAVGALVGSEKLAQVGNTAVKGLGIYKDAETARAAGLTAYAFVTQYDGNYEAAKQMGIDDPAKANSYAFVRSLLGAYSMKLFPVHQISDNLFGPGSKSAEDFFSMVSKKGLQGITQNSMRPILKKALIEGLRETKGGVNMALADKAAEYLSIAMFQPKALEQRDPINESIETAVSMGIGTLLPATIGAYRNGRMESSFHKNMMYHVGLAPSEYINGIQSQVDNGNMTQAEADKRFQTVNVLKQAVAKVPDVSPVTGKDLSEHLKVEYTNNLLKEHLIDEELKKVAGDEAQEKALNAQKAQLQAERAMMLRFADGKEVNAVGEDLVEPGTKQKPASAVTPTELTPEAGEDDAATTAETAAQPKGPQGDGDGGAAAPPAATEQYSAWDKLRQQADQLHEQGNSLPPTEMEKKKGLWGQAADLRKQADDLEATDKAEKDKQLTEDFNKRHGYTSDEAAPETEDADIDINKALPKAMREKLARQKQEKAQADAATEASKPLVHTQEFKKFFGDWEADKENSSKVVDEKGQPLVMYHGTPHGEFDEFDMEKRGTGADQNGHGDYGKGFYFTPNRETAESYANGLSEKGVGAKPAVMSVYLDMRNPFRFDKFHEAQAALAEKTREKGGIFKMTAKDDQDAIESVGLTNAQYQFMNDILNHLGDNHQDHDIPAKLKEQGYDGIIAPGGNEYVVFNKKQIRKIPGVDTNPNPHQLSAREREIIQDIRQHPKVPDFMRPFLNSNPRMVLNDMRDQLSGTHNDGSKSSLGIPGGAEIVYGREAVKKMRELMALGEDHKEGGVKGYFYGTHYLQNNKTHDSIFQVNHDGTVDIVPGMEERLGNLPHKIKQLYDITEPMGKAQKAEDFTVTDQPKVKATPGGEVEVVKKGKLAYNQEEAAKPAAGKDSYYDKVIAEMEKIGGGEQSNIRTELSRKIINAYRALNGFPPFDGPLSGLYEAAKEADGYNAGWVFGKLDIPREAADAVIKLAKDVKALEEKAAAKKTANNSKSEKFEQNKSSRLKELGLRELSAAETSKLPAHEAGRVLAGEAQKLGDFKKGDTIADAYSGEVFRVKDIKPNTDKSLGGNIYQLENTDSGDVKEVASRSGTDGNVYLPVDANISNSKKGSAPDYVKEYLAPYVDAGTGIAEKMIADFKADPVKHLREEIADVEKAIEKIRAGSRPQEEKDAFIEESEIDLDAMKKALKQVLREKGPENTWIGQRLYARDVYRGDVEDPAWVKKQSEGFQTLMAQAHEKQVFTRSLEEGKEYYNLKTGEMVTVAKKEKDKAFYQQGKNKKLPEIDPEGRFYPKELVDQYGKDILNVAYALGWGFNNDYPIHRADNIIHNHEQEKLYNEISRAVLDTLTPGSQVEEMSGRKVRVEMVQNGEQIIGTLDDDPHTHSYDQRPKGAGVTLTAFRVPGERLNIHAIFDNLREVKKAEAPKKEATTSEDKSKTFRARLDETQQVLDAIKDVVRTGSADQINKYNELVQDTQGYREEFDRDEDYTSTWAGVSKVRRGALDLQSELNGPASKVPETSAEAKKFWDDHIIMGKVPPLAGEEKTPEAKQSLDEKIKEKQQVKNDKLKAFQEALRKSRGNLSANVPLDSDTIKTGADLVGAYVDLGVHQFAAIVRDIVENVGSAFFDKEGRNLDALKGVYSYYRSQLPKAERSAFDNEDQVDDFIEQFKGEMLPELQNNEIDQYAQKLSDIDSNIEELMGHGKISDEEQDTLEALHKEASQKVAVARKKGLELEGKTKKQVDDLLNQTLQLHKKRKDGHADEPLSAEEQQALDKMRADEQAERQRNADEDSKISAEPSKTFLPPAEGKIRADEPKEVLPAHVARARVKEWQNEAQRIGKEEDRSDKVIISMFDHTGNWSKPFVDAGYTVIQLDIQNPEKISIEDESLNQAIERGDKHIVAGGNILHDPLNPLRDMLESLEKIGKKVHGILSATPCTAYARSGANHWPTHDAADFDEVERRYGTWAAKLFDTPRQYNDFLVATTEMWIDEAKPENFFAMENPVGRIGRINGLPDPTLQFNPNTYGDPYTKKTQLWGQFNPHLPQAGVEATEGSKIHSKLSSKDKVERSTTPAGFAYSFFIANTENRLNEKSATESDRPQAQPGQVPKNERETGTILDEAKSVITKAEAATTHEQRAQSAQHIDDLVAEIDRKLKGLYTNEGEQMGDKTVTETGSKLPEQRLQKDLTDYSKQLARALGGWEADVVGKGKSARRQWASTNIAPIGGEGHIILWKPGSDYGVHLTVPAERVGGAYGDPIADINAPYSEGLTIGGVFGWEKERALRYNIMTRDQKYGGGENKWVGSNITVGELSRLVKQDIEQAERRKLGTVKSSTNGQTDISGPLRPDAEGVHGGQQPADVPANEGSGDPGRVREREGRGVSKPGEVQSGKGHEPGSGTGSGLGSTYAATGDAGEKLNKRKNEKLGGESVKTPQPRTGEPRIVPDKNGNNFVIPPDFEHKSTFSPREKYNDNIKALGTLLSLMRERRTPTDAEKADLFKYVGFGGLKEVLYDPARPHEWTDAAKKYQEEVRQVHELARQLEGEGMSDVLEKIKDSTSSAFYTPVAVIRGMYDVIREGGFHGGRILDPSAGIGHFFGAMPFDIAKRSDLHGIEIEPVTGTILKHLYSDANNKVSGYEKAGTLNNYYDLVISNIPFGDQKVFDKQFSQSKDIAQVKSQQKIHNYFFAKALENARPGGLIAFVTSTGVMDSPENEFIRKHLAKNAEFLGAVRLPDTAFKKNANTEVTSDIIFLRKFQKGESVKQRHSFIDIAEDQIKHYDGRSMEKVRYNQYFKDHPEMMLGKPVAGGQYKRTDFAVQGTGAEQFQQELQNRARSIFPERSYKPEANAATNNEALKTYMLDAVQNKKPGNLVVSPDGKVAKIQTFDEKGNAHAEELKTTEPKPKLKDFINLRDRLNQVFASELNGEDDEHLSVLRKDLNTVYDDFVKKYGQLHDKKNLRLQALDIDGFNVFALERKGEKGYEKADMFSKRTVRPFVKVDRADTVKDAIPIALNESGYLNMDRISELVNKTPDEILKENPGLIYMDPSGGYAAADEYLSGNVREKLKQAEAAVAMDPRFSDNVEALKKVIPKDLKATEIEARLGSRWIDAKYYQEFARGIFNNKRLELGYRSSTDTYYLNDGGHDTVESRATFGTGRVSGQELFVEAMHGRTPVIYDTIREGGSERRVINDRETAAAVEKYNKIRDAFKDWIWKDEQRRTELGRVYNDLLNSVVERKHDGSFLQFPGYAGPEPRAHQKDAIWMIQQNNGGIVDHLVGGGKTLIMVIGAMEMRRTGTAKKPMITALKSTVPQIKETFEQAYPLAKILVPRAVDFEAKNRKAFLAQIASNDWDAVIMSHNQFEKIPQDPDIQGNLIRDELENLEEDIRDLQHDGNPLSKQQLRGLQTQKKNLEAKLEKLGTSSKDEETRYFQHLGVDHLMVDESQMFKNLVYNTKLRGVAGLGDKEGSKRAFNMLTAIRGLQELHRGDKGTTFLSGTPISNTITEMYLLFKYLRPRKLAALGMNTFDSWVTTFASNSADVEFAVTGALGTKDRFREFINVPELAMMYKEIADVRTSENLKLPRPDFKKSYTLFVPDGVTLEKTPEVGAVYEAGGHQLKIYASQEIMPGKYDIRGTYDERPEQVPTGDMSLKKVSGEGPDEIPVKGLGPSDYIMKNVKQSREQQAYTKRIIEFARTKNPSLVGLENTQNMKKAAMVLATTLSSKLAIDLRLLNPLAKDHPGGKLAVAADTIFQHYKESQDHLGTQLVFSDVGTPKTGNLVEDLHDVLQEEYRLGEDDLKLVFGEGEQKPKMDQVKKRLIDVLDWAPSKVEEALQSARSAANTFNVYDDLRAKLIQRGIPASEIDYIHNYKSDKQKLKLYDEVNNGKIRVLLGSTQKLGTGVNVQKRIVAMHHVDVPWRPADMEQRNGRGIRQGNDISRDHYGNEVPVYAYATERTLDAYKYQLLATKQHYIDQLKSGAVTDRIVRESDADEESGVGMQEMVAILSGNPDIMEMAKVAKQVQGLETSKKNFDQSQFDAQEGIRRSKSNIALYSEKQRQLEGDLGTVEQNRVKDKDGKGLYRVQLFGHDYEKPSEAGKALMDNAEAMHKRPLGDRRKIGSFNGLDVIATVDAMKMSENGKIKDVKGVELVLRSASGGNDYEIRTNMSDDTATGMAFINTLKNMESQLEMAKEKLADNKKHIIGYEDILKQQWGKDQDLKAARDKMGVLQKRLADAAKASSPDKAAATAEFGFSFGGHDELAENLKQYGKTIKDVLGVNKESEVDLDHPGSFIAKVKTISIDKKPYSLYMFRDKYGNKTYRLAPENKEHDRFLELKNRQAQFGNDKEGHYSDGSFAKHQFMDEYGEKEYDRLNQLMPSDFQEKLGIPGTEHPDAAEDADEVADQQKKGAGGVISREQQKAVQEVLSKAFPAVKTEYHDSEASFREAARQSGISGEMLPNAFIDRAGTVHYNPEKVHADTQLHENGHLLAAWAKKYAPSLYDEMLRHGRQDPFVMAELKRQGYDLPPQKMAEEAFVTLLGRQWSDEIQKTALEQHSRLGQFFKNIWTRFARYVVEKTGIDPTRLTRIAHMTTGEFINLLNEKYLVSGATISREAVPGAEGSRQVQDYGLDPEQTATAQRLITRINKGADVVVELKKVEDAYQDALSHLSDPQDQQTLQEAHRQFKDYVFDSLINQKVERIMGTLDLGLDDPNWKDRVKEKISNRFQRMLQVQRLAEASGVKITEKNDMMNWADRWRSVAQAKVHELMKEIGISDVDVFMWKGSEKISDSLFARMAKDGVDYRQMGLYLYAKHAEERNAHNARLRRDNFGVKLDELQNRLKDAVDAVQFDPSAANLGKVTKLEKQVNLYEEYQKVYEDPNRDEKLLKVLEAGVDKRDRLMDDGGSGMLNEQARDILSEVAQDPLKDKYEAYEQEIRDKVVSTILEKQLEYGLVKREEYDYLKGFYKSYVPLKVDDTYFGEGNTFSEKKIPGAKIWKSKGADYITFEQRVNPLTQSIMDLEATVMEGEQNHYRQVVAQLAKDVPDYKVWQVQSAKYKIIQNPEGRILGQQEIDEPQDAVPFYDKGIKKYIVVNDRPLYNALAENNMARSIPLLAKINSFYRNIHTVYNPEFTLSNLVRDIQHAGLTLTAEQSGTVRNNFLKNMLSTGAIVRGVWRNESGKDTGRWTQLAKEYTDLGGQMSWFGRESAIEQIKNIEGYYQKYEKTGAFEDGKQLALELAQFTNKFNQAIENSTRLNVYESLIKAGVEKHKAVEIARNATVNFNKKGTWAPTVDSLYLFYNASIQGSTNLLRAVLKSKAGRYVAGGVFMMGMLQSLINNALSDCGDTKHADDCYDNVHDYDKDKNMMFRVPGGHGFIKIPMAYGWNFIYNLGESAAQVMQGKDNWTRALAMSFMSAMEAFNPVGSADTPFLQQVSPTVTDPLVQWATNTDGLGRQINPSKPYDHRPNSERSTANNSAFAKSTAEFLNEKTGGNDKIKGKIDIQPGTIDWLIESVTGGVGHFMGRTATTAGAIADPNKHVLDDVDVKDMPIINRFLSQPKKAYDRSSIYEAVDSSYNTILSPERIEDTQKKVTELVQDGVWDEEKGKRYMHTITFNQFKLQNQDLFELMDDSKDRQLDRSEIRHFEHDMERRAKDAGIPEKTVKLWVTELRKNSDKHKHDE